jgi:hypothetical protein
MMINSDAKNVSCRGRNGWFKYHQTLICGTADANVAVEIGSVRTRNSISPIVIEGPREQILAILREAIDAVQTVGCASKGQG